MFFAEGTSSLGIERLPFQINLTSRAIEALRMPVLIKSLNPTIARLNGELTTVALSLEHRLPIFFTVRLAIFHVEGTLADLAAALHAKETLGMVGVLQGIHALPHDGVSALLAARSEVLLVIFLAEQLTLLLNEADPDEGRLAVRVGAEEVIGAPGLVQGQHKRSSDGDAAGGAHGDASAVASGTHALGLTSASGSHRTGSRGDTRLP